MKKILLVILMLWGFSASGQGVRKIKRINIGGNEWIVQDLTAIAGYTNVRVRYQFIAMALDSGLHIPQYNGVPSGVRSGVWTADGAIAADTANHRLYFYSGGSWRYSNASTSGGTPTLQEVITAGSTLTGNNTIAGGGFDFTFDNIGTFKIRNSSIDRIGVSGGGGGSTILYSPDGNNNFFISNSGTFFGAGGVYGQSLTNLSTQNRLVGIYGLTSQIGYVTLGTGLSLSSGVLSNSGVTSTPTWQQTLTAGSTLTGANTINGGNANLIFSNTSNFNVIANLGIGLKYANDFCALCSDELTPQVGMYSKDQTRSFRVGNTFHIIGGLANLSTQDRLIGQRASTSEVGYVTLGTGLSLSSGVLNSTWTTSGNDIYKNNSGNVGIGTSTPATKFHTVGTVRHQTLGTAITDTTTYKPLVINSSGDVLPSTYWYGGGGGASPAGSNKQVQYNNSGSFGGAAGVEIGNTNNRLLIQSQSTTELPLILKMAASQTANIMSFQNSSGTELSYVDKDGDAYFNGIKMGKYGGEKGFEITTTKDMYFVTGGDELSFEPGGGQTKMRITYYPTYSQRSLVYGGNTLYEKYGTNLSFYPSSGNSGFGAGGTENLLYITTTGNVGIGTTSPGKKLDVVGNGRLQFDALAADTAMIIDANTTAAASNSQVGLAIRLRGANATASQTTKALYVENLHSGTSPVDIGIHVKGSVSGGIPLLVEGVQGEAAIDIRPYNASNPYVPELRFSPTLGPASKIYVNYGNLFIDGGYYPYGPGDDAMTIFGSSGIGNTYIKSYPYSVPASPNNWMVRTRTAEADAIGLVIDRGATSQTADLFQFRRSDNTVLSRFDSIGYLGIGTAPSTALDVAGTASIDGLNADRTITAGGTTGNQTINKMAGTVNIAAAGTTVTVTNSLVDASSIIFCTLRTNDATATIKNVVPGAGSFVITLTAAATAEVSIGFMVTN